MKDSPSLRSLDSLKREAKAIKKAKGCKLSEAQDALARRYGFATWGLLHKHHPEAKAREVLRTLVTRDEMLEWFLAHYAADTSNPFDDGISPPSTDVSHALLRQFSTADQNTLDGVAEELEQEGDWVSSNVLAAIEWFLENHERAVERTPYESREGGYLYPLVDVYDVISNTFLELPEEDIDAVVEAIEHYDDAWVDADFFRELDSEALAESSEANAE